MNIFMPDKIFKRLFKWHPSEPIWRLKDLQTHHMPRGNLETFHGLWHASCITWSIQTLTRAVTPCINMLSPPPRDHLKSLPVWLPACNTQEEVRLLWLKPTCLSSEGESSIAARCVASAWGSCHSHPDLIQNNPQLSFTEGLQIISKTDQYQLWATSKSHPSAICVVPVL